MVIEPKFVSFLNHFFLFLLQILTYVVLNHQSNVDHENKSHHGYELITQDEHSHVVRNEVCEAEHVISDE